MIVRIMLVNCPMVSLQIISHGQTRTANINSNRDLMLNMGDTIRCLSGEAVALVNPGTMAGAYILKTKAPIPTDGKTVSILTLDAYTTRPRHRSGTISVAPDIGNIMRATGHTTR